MKESVALRVVDFSVVDTGHCFDQTVYEGD
jgi:hypothetical protein